MRNRVFIGAIVLLIVFLAGFVPQFVKAQRLDRELRLAHEQDAGADLRDLAAMTYVQANQKNYGLAADTAARFFNRTREMASQARDPNSRPAFDAVLARRDTVTAKLAKGEAGVMDDLNQVFMQTRDATRRSGEK